jgi:microbial collagenase
MSRPIFPSMQPRPRSLLGTLLCLAGLLAYGAASAAPPPTPDEAELEVDHNQRRTYSAAQRPLQRSPAEVLPQTDYSAVSPRPARDTGAQAQSEQCRAAITAANASQLLPLLRAADPVGCLYGLFGLRGSAASATFSATKMLRAAQGLRSDALNYPGNNSLGSLQLLLYLRAGYYLNYVDPVAVPDFGSALAAEVGAATDAMLAAAAFDAVDESNGLVNYEWLIMMDSANDMPRMVAMMLRRLQRYDHASYAINGDMERAVFVVFDQLFRNAGVNEFVAAVRARPALVDALYNFILDHEALVGETARRYLLRAAAGELARFADAAYATQPREQARLHLRALLQRYPRVGVGGPLWVQMADYLDYYDASHCAWYGTCGWREQTIALLLPQIHDCSPSLRLRAMALSPTEVQYVCTQMAGLGSYFHQRLQTGGQPLPGDLNSRLEMVIFDSHADYTGYADALYGIDTNNGGIYIEGDPAQPGNQARFFAYEVGSSGSASWEIWNLHHEYIHYLDGRYNLPGGFCDAPLGGLCGSGPAGSAVWYIEGMAEVLAYGFRSLNYARAVDAARTRRFQLSQLFDTVYSNDFSRTYQWGYLASRYLLEWQPQRMQALLQLFRQNRMPDYLPWVQGIGSSRDAEFQRWLDCFIARNGAADDCDPARVFVDGFEPEPPLPECDYSDSRQLGSGCRRSALASGTGLDFYFNVPAGVQRLVIETRDGSGNADLYLRRGTWASVAEHDASSTQAGNVERIEIGHPQAGQWFAYLRAATPYAGAEIRVRYE